MLSFAIESDCMLSAWSDCFLWGSWNSVILLGGTIVKLPTTWAGVIRFWYWITLCGSACTTCLGIGCICITDIVERRLACEGIVIWGPETLDYLLTWWMIWPLGGMTICALLVLWITGDTIALWTGPYVLTWWFGVKLKACEGLTYWVISRFPSNLWESVLFISGTKWSFTILSCS